MTKRIFLLIAFIIFLFNVAVDAQAKTTQKESIKKGIKTGEITSVETSKIIEERKEVRADVKEAKSDGVITRAEKTTIKKERNDTQKAILRAKKNKRVRN